MREMDRIQYYRDKIKKNPQLEKEIEQACDFILESEEVLHDNLIYMLDGGCKQDYKLLPFGTDGTCGVYVLVDDTHVAYITFEGFDGYLADNVDDFYKILLNCWYLSDYFEEDVLCDIESFRAKYEEIKQRFGEKKAIDAFLDEEGMRLTPEEIYPLLKRGMSITPIFKVDPIDENFFGSENLLGMEEEDFLEFLRRWSE